MNKNRLIKQTKIRYKSNNLKKFRKLRSKSNNKVVLNMNIAINTDKMITI